VIGGAAAGGAGAGEPKAAAKPAADDEDVDLFGEDGDAAAAAVKVEKKEEAAPKKVKEKPIARSICIYEVKPACDDGDGDDDENVKIATPKEMEDAIRSIQVDGLIWSETFNVVEMAFGVKVQFVCEDEKVSLDDIEERMLAFEDVIQSVDQVRAYSR
jgi:translation elongation factor EF-1beta